jgi:dolichyl-phosphate-mannose--protein O-mannosyl transferase
LKGSVLETSFRFPSLFKQLEVGNMNERRKRFAWLLIAGLSFGLAAGSIYRNIGNLTVALWLVIFGISMLMLWKSHKDSKKDAKC